MTDYESRLSIPVNTGSDELELFNASGNVLTKGYTRIVIGDRGPYVEFQEKNIIGDVIFLPDSEKDRMIHPEKYYYAELRTQDESYTKIYYQFKKVNYADYRIGMFYISPFDLYQKKENGELEVLIEPLKKKQGKEKDVTA